MTRGKLADVRLTALELEVLLGLISANAPDEDAEMWTDAERRALATAEDELRAAQARLGRT